MAAIALIGSFTLVLPEPALRRLLLPLVGLAAGSLGRRKTFADIGQSLASYFGLPPMEYGESFIPGEARAA